MHVRFRRQAAPNSPPTIRDEFSLISRLEGLLPPEPKSVRLGRGVDDAAVVKLKRGLLVATCDVQIEGTHFLKEWIKPRQLGRRSAAVNLSDIASMGAVPLFALVSLFLPKSASVHFFDEVMRGIGDQLLEFDAHVVGGNLARSKRECIVDITLFGTVEPNRYVERSGARPGNRLLVTGVPGESAAGFELVRRGLRDIGGMKKRFLQPQPRVAAGQLLAKLGATSMIDISDGLASDLLHLCDASQVGVMLSEENFPISLALSRAGKKLHKDPGEWVLQGGEAYELLFTIPPKKVLEVQRTLWKKCALRAHEIGQMVPRNKGHWIHTASDRRQLRDLGFTHF